VRRFSAVLPVIVVIGLVVTLALSRVLPPKQAGHRLRALSQTYIALHPGAPLDVPPLFTTDGRLWAPGELQGHWSVIFFGFTGCPLVCPKTLSVLTAVSRNPASGISSGLVEPLFVSVDPEHDTPTRMAAYLKHFDSHIAGLTGNGASIARFSSALGAGYQPAGSSIDHSTSLFVVDPKGRLAGILLRPNDPARIVADLTALRFPASQARAMPPR
jgi:protein SCO1